MQRDMQEQVEKILKKMVNVTCGVKYFGKRKITYKQTKHKKDNENGKIYQKGNKSTAKEGQKHLNIITQDCALTDDNQMPLSVQ